jgi:hypothetical protein
MIQRKSENARQPTHKSPSGILLLCHVFPSPEPERQRHGIFGDANAENREKAKPMRNADWHVCESKRGTEKDRRVSS